MTDLVIYKTVAIVELVALFILVMALLNKTSK